MWYSKRIMFDLKKERKRILFVGIPDMAYVCLDACISAGVNIVGVLGPKPSHNMFNNFKNFVKARGLNFIECNDFSNPDFIKRIKDLNIDMGVVSSFNYKIPKVLLKSTKDGFINLHPSLLPLYRGANPYSRVILNNETETGVTLHYMDEEFDAGDIILQVECPIEPDETMGTLFNKTNEICVQLLLSALDEYEKRTLPRIKQRTGDFIKAPNVSPKETSINYNNTATFIERQIRALNPFILANTFFRQEYIRVMSAKVINLNIEDDIPNGTIVAVNDDVVIKTGEKCIAFETMQYGSYFVGTSKDFIKYIKPKVGERFY